MRGAGGRTPPASISQIFPMHAGRIIRIVRGQLPSGAWESVRGLPTRNSRCTYVATKGTLKHRPNQYGVGNYLPAT